MFFSQMRPEILQQMLQTVLNIIMFEDCRFVSMRIFTLNLSFKGHFHIWLALIANNIRNQWSMSRPLLGLILLNEDYFQVHLKTSRLMTSMY